MDLKRYFYKKSRGFNQKSLIVRFSFSLSLIILLFVLSIFTGMINNKKMIEREMLSRARSHFDNIVLTREISEITSDTSGYQFHITSLKPINPDNAPDGFETKALEAFERGLPEIFQREIVGDDTFFRYMGPLVTDRSCLACHEEQGYKEGDIRGGISVKFNINEIEKNLKLNKYLIIVLSASTSILLLGIFYFLILRLNKNLKEALKQIKTMAERDSLTGLYNRRFVFEQADKELEKTIRYKYEMSLILLDIDFFKKINDSYGHSAGDKTLIETASIMMNCMRKTDIVSRYGGEEFLIVLPGTGREGALSAAENLLEKLREHEISISGKETIQTTASIGVSSWDFSYNWKITSLDGFIESADKAMYQVKKEGRNRIVTA